LILDLDGAVDTVDSYSKTDAGVGANIHGDLLVWLALPFLGEGQLWTRMVVDSWHRSGLFLSWGLRRNHLNHAEVVGSVLGIAVEDVSFLRPGRLLTNHLGQSEYRTRIRTFTTNEGVVRHCLIITMD